MNRNERLRHAAGQVSTSLGRAFETTAAWLAKLSWWKFFLFAAILLIAGKIMQETLFSTDERTEIVVDQPKKKHKIRLRDGKGDGMTGITIDENGIHVRKDGQETHLGPDGVVRKEPPADNAAAPATPAPPSAADGAAGAPEAPDAPAAPDADPHPAAPQPPKNEPMMEPTAPAKGAITTADGVHIALPPEISAQVTEAIEEAVDDAAERKVVRYRRQSSEWFMNFILLLSLGLFGMKALMGGKKRAEAEAQSATELAEREALQRQVSEAKMQMMQAQVEPHFLFNTLASVEHLIETDPPRASRMQRSLITYLRAVLPQMRETATVTNLGRETDIVRSYLDLLKMRMEERLQVRCDIPDGLRSAAFPPMMLQSLVENAIKHGLECKEEGGHLAIAAEVVHNRLRVTVADDGVGFGVMPSDGTGLGLQSIRDRLKLLHGEESSLTIAPNQPSGVIATIEVPYALAKVGPM